MAKSKDTKRDQIEKLLAISLLDGRNRDKVAGVSNYFSEFALIKNRLRLEIKYLIFLSQNTKIVRKLTNNEKRLLESLWTRFTPDEAILVKGIEEEINHDVKAVEYYLQRKLKNSSLRDIIPFVHIGLTSYDINIPAYGLILSEFRQAKLVPLLSRLLSKLKQLILACKSMPMLGRTHGQPALPTSMGKELAVFYRRLVSERRVLTTTTIEAKLTGAVGNFNAHKFAFPEYDWTALSKKFINSLGLVPNLVTTQIIPYDSWLRYFDSLKRVNYILLNFVQDIWWYISFEYFQQKKKEKEVGSSTMSQKINPITFENAEGNLQLANSLFEFFVRKLSVSRLQRDLSDSTIKRDFGLAFGFTVLAWDSILSGLDRVSPNATKMRQDLDNHWEVFAEGIQTFLRAKGYNKAYELLKDKTRGKMLTKESLHQLIDSLSLKAEDKKKLKISSLEEYLGLTEEITEIAVDKE